MDLVVVKHVPTPGGTHQSVLPLDLPQVPQRRNPLGTESRGDQGPVELEATATCDIK